MHMADALVSPAVAGTMYGLSALAAGWSVKKVHDEDFSKKIPLMGVMGAFVFATQMINFTIPGTGSSGHLCGDMLLSALLGPYAGFLTMIGVLLIQCLFFADGGLLALGCNIWNMSFYGCFIGSLLWKLIMNKNCKQWKIVVASIAGCVVTLQLGAFSVTLETLASRITDLPFGVFVGTMLPIHLAIGFVEGLITAAVLSFVFAARPEFLWGIGYEEVSDAEPVADGEKPQAVPAKKGFLSARNTLIVLACLALVIGGGLSLVASSNPDGLEWAMEKIAGTAELEPTENALSAAEGAGKVAGAGIKLERKGEKVFLSVYDEVSGEKGEAGFLIFAACPGRYDVGGESVTIREVNAASGMKAFIAETDDGCVSGEFRLPVVIRSGTSSDSFRTSAGERKLLSKIFSEWHVMPENRWKIPVFEDDEKRGVWGSLFGYPDWFVKIDKNGRY